MNRSMARRYSALVRLRIAAPSRRSSAASVFVALGCAALAIACTAQGAAASDRPAPPSLKEEKLRSALAENRAFMIERLHDYWMKGDFVQNPARNGGPGNFILDDRGKPCPLASIIIEAGRRDLVDEAARRNNNVKIVDLQDGPILDWILQSGLTQEECVLIQRPSKSGADIAKPVRDEETRRLANELSRVEQILRDSSERSLTLSVRRMLAAQRARNTPRL